MTDIDASDNLVFFGALRYDLKSWDKPDSRELEFLIVVNPNKISLADYRVEFYNGSNSNSYGIKNIETTPFRNHFHKVILNSNNKSGWIQNGPDGMALIRLNGGGVPDIIQFISYEGTITARNDNAVEFKSTDIGVSQSGNDNTILHLERINDDTQLNTYGKFTWTKNSDFDRDVDINDIPFDELITIHTDSGVYGDPYICTLNNDFYKMSNFQGNSRMLQGSYKDKLLTINAYTRFSTDKEREETKKYAEMHLKLYELLNPNSTSDIKAIDYIDNNNVYISKTHIQWGDQYILADMDNLIILENTTDFKITYSYDEPEMLKDTMVQMPELKHYKSETEKAIKISFPGQLEIILAYSENPQVRGSYKIKNGHLVNIPQGALVHKMYEKDIRVRKLNDLRALKWSGNRNEPRSVTREKYVNKEGDICVKLIPIY